MVPCQRSDNTAISQSMGYFGLHLLYVQLKDGFSFIRPEEINSTIPVQCFKVIKERDSPIPSIQISILHIRCCMHVVVAQ